MVWERAWVARAEMWGQEGVEFILLHVKRRWACVTKYNLDTCLIVIGHRLDTDELYNICHPNMYMKHGL